MKVELLVQLCVNGRPIWRKTRVVKSELTFRMTDKEYGRVVDSAALELSNQVMTARANAAKKPAAAVGEK